MTKARANREEFSFDVPRDAKKARGGLEALKSATDALGPFEYEMRLDALEKQSVRSREGHRVVICREQAQRLVRNLATIYLESKFLYDRAPRIQSHIQKLERLHRSLENAVDDLISLDDFNVFDIYGTVLLNKEPTGFDIHHELPLPSSWSKDAGPLIEHLSTFQNLVSATLDRAKNTFSRASRGGNMNVLTVLGQIPREVLAKEALFIFEIFTGKGARSHQDSDFLLFVNAIHEFATGIDPEEAGMRHAVANVVRDELERREYLAGIEDELATLEALPQNDVRDRHMSFLREQRFNLAFSLRSLTYDS